MLFRLISLLACSSVERHSEGGRLAAPAESQSAPRATCQWELLWSVAVWECGRVGHTTLGPRQNRPREPARPNHAHAGHLHRPRIMSNHVRNDTPVRSSETPSRSVFLGEAGADTNCIIKVRPCRIRYRTPLPQVNGQALPHRKQNRTDAQSTGVHRLTRRARAPPSL